MAMNGKHSCKESELAEMVNHREKRPSQYSIMGASKQARATCSLTIVVLFIVSMILVVVGISLIIVSIANKNECAEPKQENWKYCGFSEEAKRAGFDTFLKEIKEEFFRLHPHQSYHDPAISDLPEGAELSVLKRKYKPFNPKPSNLKKITEASLDLLRKLNAININNDALKPRELKALIQAKHYLKHTFGQPYDMNYYAGDWMMGPNHFCWQPVCDMGKDIFYHLDYYKPNGLKGLDELRDKLQEHADAVYQYINNMKEGVQRGMIRSVEDCKAGIDAVKQRYLNISLRGEKAVLESWFMGFVVVPEFLSNITEKEDTEWFFKNDEHVRETVNKYFIELIGKPVVDLLNYLQNDHIRHCVPSSVPNGLSDLPQNYVFLDGVQTSQRTNKTLPFGEAINCSKTYEMMLSYFTTTDLTADRIYDLGYEQVERLYPQVLEIARNLTGLSNDTEAVREFRKMLNKSSNYYNEEPFPKNESNEEAHKKCSNIEGAKKYCPKRWEAAEKWWADARMAMSLIDSKTINMFYFTGKKHTTPNCPVELHPDLNPSSGAQSYIESDYKCTEGAAYNLPFFLNNAGPKFSEWSVNAHEARPGHHTQVQGNIEHFADNCDDSISWLHSITYHTAFVEGWALYAESPLVSETDIYDHNLMQKYGMLKWQIWRALRLVVDTGIHTKSLTRAAALDLFDKYAWDVTDIARKEVTRYQSVYGQATAYTIGQLWITQLRNKAKSKLKKKFSLKEFHYQLLSQGSSPLSYLTTHIKKYAQCKFHPENGDGGKCNYIFSPPEMPTPPDEIRKRVAGRPAKPSLPYLRRQRYT
ncbi:uncharacterized protein LOC114533870 [Dendronephthya gigantea]|uniref:uncharacterized protein LOC114533870 n=1 Tax=Dendronephthya gigantea TaxID=151771 RepID=UPI00106A6D7A|nr:uncharacterized protein LOC114533870 [Dendronephthya gigantea]